MRMEKTMLGALIGGLAALAISMAAQGSLTVAVILLGVCMFPLLVLAAM